MLYLIMAILMSGFMLCIICLENNNINIKSRIALFIFIFIVINITHFAAFKIYNYVKISDSNLATATTNEEKQFKPYAEKVINRLPLQRLNLNGLKINNDDKTITVFYKDQNNVVKSIDINNNRKGYFAFDKVTITQDNSTSFYMEYRQLKSKLSSKNYSNTFGYDDVLNVYPDYYSIEIHLPKGYTIN